MGDNWTPEDRAEFVISHAQETPGLLKATLVKMIRDHREMKAENERLKQRIKELEEGEPIALPPPD